MVQCSLYADDLAVYYASPDIANAAEKIQSAVNRASEWANSRGFKFSASKTVALHFCKRAPRVNVPPNITLNGELMTYDSVVKFLGLYFDSGLTWKPHLQQLKIKGIQALNILKVVSGYAWGADQSTLLKLYGSLCKSKINYACQIYSSASVTNLKMLDVVHNQALRICTGAYRTSPVESLNVTAGERPLNLQRELLSINYYLKTQGFPDSLAFKILGNFSLIKNYLFRPKRSRPLHIRLKEVSSFNDMKILKCQPFRMPPWLVPPIKTCVIDIKKSEHSADSVHSVFLDHLQQHQGSVAVYTDGSKSNSAVGCAAVVGDSEYSARLSGAVSSYSAELFAILLVVKNLFYRHTSSNFTVFTDSRSALSALNTFYPDNPIILDIHYFLYKLFSIGKNVSFCWSPGHVGIRGNERADLAAKSAASRVTVDYLPVPFLDTKFHSRSFILEKFQHIWSKLFTNSKLELIQHFNKPWPVINRQIGGT